MGRNTWLAFAAGVAIILAALYFSVQQPELVASTTPTPIPGPTFTPVPTTARAGDTVEVDYTLRTENGSVYDTTIEAIARSAGIWREDVEYGPLTFTLGRGEVIPGFEEAIMGMSVGEEKTFTVPPEKGYGRYDPMNIQELPRIYAMPRTEAVPMQSFLRLFPDFDFTVTMVSLPGAWNATILAVTNDTVLLRHDPIVGQHIVTGSWPERVLNVTDEEVILLREPAEDGIYYTTDAVGRPILATVRRVKNDTMTLDYNHPLAGQTLNFTVKLLRIR